MDKKRRDNSTTTTLETEFECKQYWTSLMQATSTVEVCGLYSKKFKFLNNYGSGYFEFHSFDGLYIGITDVALKEDLKMSGLRAYDTLELSYLLEGEQIINLKNSVNDIVFESLECYLLYLSNNSGKITYLKNKLFKEVKIRMSNSFIEKHNLYEAYNFKETHRLRNNHENFISPICPKKQEILSEILSDQRKGLLKRLFLESKVLELLALQLDSQNKSVQKDVSGTGNLIKKMYAIQNIIMSDLTTQFSIQQLAREVGLNDFVIKKEFKRIFNQTIFEFALEQRMLKAKKLLNHSQKPIYEISETIGYKNATHFSAAFKKVTGKTPKKYRDTLL